jgi:membrane-bound metal-dependent hydrolase YbcI (DUF457 family)
MYPLGHVGIGTRIIPARIRELLRWRWLAFGCLLPDVIDKPIYVTAILLRRAGAEHLHLHLLRGSRLFGHTLFFLAVLVAAAAWLRSGPLRAVSWAVATHLLLDLVPDVASGGFFEWRTWLLWPLFGWGFPPVYSGAVVGGVNLESATYVVGDLLGASLLVWQYARSRRARA